jgi:hypothetical protein
MLFGSCDNDRSWPKAERRLQDQVSWKAVVCAEAGYQCHSLVAPGEPAESRRRACGKGKRGDIGLMNTAALFVFCLQIALHRRRFHQVIDFLSVVEHPELSSI